MAHGLAHRWALGPAIALALIMCAADQVSMSRSSSTSSISKTAYGKSPSGVAIDLYTLRNGNGMQATIATYGGIVTSLTAPDRTGRFADVVLGYDSLGGYVAKSPYFGALVGRYANRIAHARFTLDGRSYTLFANDGANSLHGGRVGFDKVVWTVRAAKLTPDGKGVGGEPQLTLAYLSRSGEEGYPGNLSVEATYTLTNDNALRLDYRATTDQPTIINLSHHSYFNLRGSGDVLGHVVQINADRFTPVDSALIPTGALEPVSGTPFDFRTPTAIGARIAKPNEQLRFAKGYDDNWVINNATGGLALQATVYEPETGRVLEVLSTEPGLQFYSGNFLDGSITGKGGWVYQHRDAFVMEPQHFPDSPNHLNFPSTTLRPGQAYRSTIIYRFSAK